VPIEGNHHERHHHERTDAGRVRTGGVEHAAASPGRFSDCSGEALKL